MPRFESSDAIKISDLTTRNRPFVSIVVPTHNPDRERLRRTLIALRDQTLPANAWETVVVDNASEIAIDLRDYGDAAPANLRVVAEAQLGLSAARRRGIAATNSPLLLFVDDDNLLAPDYLQRAIAHFDRDTGVGIAGGKIVPEFARPPSDWTAEFHALLALRDLGASTLVSRGLQPNRLGRNEYPPFAPVGAGMVLRRQAAEAWASPHTNTGLTDRRGDELSSSGDNDVVLAAMKTGWEVAYYPDLMLTHLIPASRLDPAYLGRLNRGIQQSWMQVLTHHDANPWPPLSRWGAQARKARAWLTYQPWRSPAAFVRWQGACGHFEGRVGRTRRQPAGPPTLSPTN